MDIFQIMQLKNRLKKQIKPNLMVDTRKLAPIVEQLMQITKEKKLPITAIEQATGISKERIYKWKKGHGRPRPEDEVLLEAFINDIGESKAINLTTNLNQLIAFVLEHIAANTAHIKVILSLVTLLESERRQSSYPMVEAELNALIRSEAQQILDLLTLQLGLSKPS